MRTEGSVIHSKLYVKYTVLLLFRKKWLKYDSFYFFYQKEKLEIELDLGIRFRHLSFEFKQNSLTFSIIHFDIMASLSFTHSWNVSIKLKLKHENYF